MEKTLVLTKSSVEGREGSGYGYKKDTCGILVVLELCILE